MIQNSLLFAISLNGHWEIVLPSNCDDRGHNSASAKEVHLGAWRKKDDSRKKKFSKIAFGAKLIHDIGIKMISPVSGLEAPPDAVIRFVYKEPQQSSPRQFERNGSSKQAVSRQSHQQHCHQDEQVSGMTLLFYYLN